MEQTFIAALVAIVNWLPTYLAPDQQLISSYLATSLSNHYISHSAYEVTSISYLHKILP